MNLRSLRYFVKFSEYGSITRAALELHITQPSLTQHLKHLEEDLGVALIMRHGRGVILTEAGKLLRDRGQVLLEQLEVLRSELESSAVVPRGTLSVGMPISWSERVTYPVMERFRTEHPDVRVKLIVNSSEALAAAMNGNEIQFAVLTEIDDLDPFIAAPILVDGLFLVGPATSDIGAMESAQLTDLVEFPMILPLNSTVGLSRIDRILAAAGRRLKCVVETQSSNILPLVARGIGYTALGAAGLPPLGAGSSFTAIPIIDLSMTWTLAVPRNRPRTAAVAVFERFVRERVEHVIRAGGWRTARILAPQPPSSNER